MNEREQKEHDCSASGDDPSPALEATLSFTGGGDAPVDRAVTRVDSSSSRYKLEREVARGGLGRVLSAYDVRLRRAVAIKELLLKTSDLETRFNREVEITARLQHPGIVPVYDAGAWEGGAPFYVMKLLSDGQTLKRLVEESLELADRVALVGNVIAVADAVAYAHNLGIIHRDIKPSNVIVGPFGETVVIDWGLAKDLTAPPVDEMGAHPYRSASEQETIAGAVLGTPQYMAPEQSRGEAADRRTDVYALGALLYYVLARKAPHVGESAADVVQRVRTAEPLPVTSHVDGIPPDLSAIVAKAMSRAPADRYPDAGKLVEDLRRFHTGQLVRAHSYSFATLLGRWGKRHRTLLTASAVFVLVLALVGAVGVGRIARERAAAVAERNKLVLLQARSSLEHDPTRAVAWLKTYPEGGPDADQAAAIASSAASLGVARNVLNTGMLSDAAFLPDGRSFVASNFTDHVAWWDAISGRRLAEIPFEGTANDVDVSPDGNSAAICGYNGQVVLWDLGTKQNRVLDRARSPRFRVAFSPNGQFLAASSGAGSVDVWDLARGVTHHFQRHAGPVLALAFSADSKTIVSAEPSGRLLVTSIDTGQVRELDAPGGLRDIALSDDGEILAVATVKGEVWLWALAKEQPPQVLGQPGPSMAFVRFVPHGHVLVSADLAGAVAVWSETGTLIRRSAPVGKIARLAVSLDGRVFATGLDDGRLLLWDVATGATQPLLGHSEQVTTLAFAIDGTLLSGGTNPTARLWTPEARQRQPRRIIDVTDPALHVVFSHDGRLLASEAGRLVHLCSTTTGTCRTFAGHRAAIFGLTFSPDGKRLASAGWDGTARVWDVATGAAQVFEAGTIVRSVLFTPDGQRLIAGSNDGVIHIWQLDGGPPQQLRSEKSEMASLALSPRGDKLVAGGADGTVRLWSLLDGSSRLLGRHPAAVVTAAFAPDGERIASSGKDGSVRLWSATNSSERSLEGHRDIATSISFSADGSSLAVASWDNTASIWDLRSGARSILRGHDGRVRAIALSRDGRWAATSSDDKTVRLWDLRTHQVDVLRGNQAPVRGVAFSPTEGLLATSSDDGTIRLWDVMERAAVPLGGHELWTWMSHVTTMMQ